MQWHAAQTVSMQENTFQVRVMERLAGPLRANFRPQVRTSAASCLQHQIIRIPQCPHSGSLSDCFGLLFIIKISQHSHKVESVQPCILYRFRIPACFLFKRTTGYFSHVPASLPDLMYNNKLIILLY